jgi:hypothetical protein
VACHRETESLPPASLIVVGRPDYFDPAGALHAYARENGFSRRHDIHGLAVWSRPQRL